MEQKMIDLQLGDCLEVMKDIEDESIDCILTDPPYFQIKGDFDFTYESHGEYLDFMEKCAIEFKRILKKNGSLYLFAHAKRVAYVQVIFDKYFNLENNLVWHVIDRQTNRGIAKYRCFAPVTERILFYSCHNPTKWDKTGLKLVMNDVDNFKSLREYFKRVYEFIGKPKKAIMGLVGQRADHAFRYASTQWDLPTIETYQELINCFGIDKMTGFIEYESLRLEYESLRRPFNNIHLLTDVIKHSQESHISRKFAHDTVKPLGLIEKLIETSTLKNMVVFDPFLGSGTVAAACLNTNRSFIGIEKDSEYFDIATKRISDAKTHVLGGLN